MDMKLRPARLGGTVPAIASKSSAHRLLICAALAESGDPVRYTTTSEDIEATAACLRALGEARKNNTHAVLPCKESGSTLRFLLPVCCALGISAEFQMEGRLPQRPLSPLYEELTAHGATLSAPGSNPLRVSGQLLPGDYTLSGGVSSQYFSGLLFALPLLAGDSVLRVEGRLESRPYLDLTLGALGAFGIRVMEEAQVFHIPGGQKYTSPGALHVEGDWSNAAFWLCAGAMGGAPVTCTGLDLNSAQGDRAIVPILERFGARVSVAGDQVTVSPGTLRGIHIDAENIPDLVPILSVVASAAAGTTTIGNAGRLRLKESDRLRTVTALLTALGGEIWETEAGLVIRGTASLHGGDVSAAGDHRIAMSAAIAATRCTAPVVIRGAQAVNKSYPRFFDDYRALGGNAEEAI